MTRPTGKRAVIWSVVFIVLSPLLAGPGSSLAGQDGPDRLRAQVGVMGRAYDNFFREADESEARTIFAWTEEARVLLRPIVSPVVEIYGEVDFTRYESLGSSPGAGVGLMFWSRTHVMRMNAHYQEERPVFDVGDVTRFAQLSQLSGFYSFRPGSSWRFDLDGRIVRVGFDELPQANSTVYVAGGSVRYRALGYFQPELGGHVGWRDAVDPNQNNTRGHVSLGVASVLTDPLRVNVRYRFRSRRYTGADIAGGNFGRSDEGGQWTAVSLLRASQHLHVRLIYNRMDMDSTLESRIYSSQSVALGATVLF